MSENTPGSAKEFYDQQRHIYQSVQTLPDAIDERIANRLALHEARIAERLHVMERSSLIISIIAAIVVTVAVVGTLYALSL